MGAFMNELVTSVSVCGWVLVMAAVVMPFTWLGTPKDFWWVHPVHASIFLTQASTPNWVFNWSSFYPTYAYPPPLPSFWKLTTLPCPLNPTLHDRLPFSYILSPPWPPLPVSFVPICFCSLDTDFSSVYAVPGCVKLTTSGERQKTSNTKFKWYFLSILFTFSFTSDSLGRLLVHSTIVSGKYR